MGRTSSLLLVACVLAGCAEVPRDPADTLEQARGGVLRVGVTEAPPWVVRSGGGVPGGASADAAGGLEPELIRSFARSIDARVEWVWGGAEENLMKLERRELALVAAGLTHRTPWRGRVALTRPHTNREGERHVLAAAPGENALLVALERHLRAPR